MTHPKQKCCEKCSNWFLKTGEVPKQLCDLTCPCHSPKQEWEKEFEVGGTFGFFNQAMGININRIDVLKSFISSLLLSAEEKGRKSCPKWHINIDDPNNLKDPRDEIFEKGREQGRREVEKKYEELLTGLEEEVGNLPAQGHDYSADKPHQNHFIIREEVLSLITKLKK